MILVIALPKEWSSGRDLTESRKVHHLWISPLKLLSCRWMNFSNCGTVCVPACAFVRVCLCVLEAEPRQRDISAPRERRDWGGDDKCHWKSVALLGSGVAGALASKLVHIFPLQKQPEPPRTYRSCCAGGDLLSWVQPFAPTRLYFCFTSLCKVTPGSWTLSAAARGLSSLHLSPPRGFFPLDNWGIMSAGAEGALLTSLPSAFRKMAL